MQIPLTHSTLETSVLSCIATVDPRADRGIQRLAEAEQNVRINLMKCDDMLNCDEDDSLCWQPPETSLALVPSNILS